MKNTSVLFSVALLAGALALPAHAQVRTEKNMSMMLAHDIAMASVAACAEKKYNVTATVVDRAGQVKAVVRADNAGPHTVEGSRKKAFTAASTKRGTTASLERVQKDPSLQYLITLDPGFAFVGGGLPVTSGDEVIGAVGISGAPGGHLDDECGNAALAKVKDQLK